jgi:hypothetical protein
MATKQKSSIPYNYSENVNNCVEIPVRLTQVNNADEFPLLHAKDLEWDFILDNIQSIDYKYIEDYIYKGVSIKDNPNRISRYINDIDGPSNKPLWYSAMDENDSKLCQIKSTNDVLDIINFLIGRCTYLDATVKDLTDQIHLQNVEFRFYQDLDTDIDGQPNDVKFEIKPLIYRYNENNEYISSNTSLVKYFKVSTNPYISDESFVMDLSFSSLPNFINVGGAQDIKVLINRENSTNTSSPSGFFVWNFILTADGFDLNNNEYKCIANILTNSTAQTNKIDPAQFGITVSKAKNRIKKVIINDKEYIYFGPGEIYEQLKNLYVKKYGSNPEYSANTTWYHPCLIEKNIIDQYLGYTINKEIGQNGKDTGFYKFNNEEIDNTDPNITGSYEWLKLNGHIYSPVSESASGSSTGRIHLKNEYTYKIFVEMEYDKNDLDLISINKDTTPIKYYCNIKNNNTSSIIYGGLLSPDNGKANGEIEIDNTKTDGYVSPITGNPINNTIYTLKLIHKGTEQYDLIKYAKYVEKDNNKNWYYCDENGIETESTPINVSKYEKIEIYSMDHDASNYNFLSQYNNFSFNIKAATKAGGTGGGVSLDLYLESTGTRYIASNKIDESDPMSYPYIGYPMKLPLIISEAKRIILVKNLTNNYSSYDSEDYPYVSNVKDSILNYTDNKENVISISAIDIIIPIVSTKSFNGSYTELNNKIDVNSFAKIDIYKQYDDYNSQNTINEICGRLFNVTHSNNYSNNSFVSVDNQNIFNKNISIDYEASWKIFNSNSYSKYKFNQTGTSSIAIGTKELLEKAGMSTKNWDNLTDGEKGKRMIDTFVSLKSSSSHLDNTVIIHRYLQCNAVTSTDIKDTDKKYYSDVFNDKSLFCIPIVFKLPKSDSGSNILYDDFSFCINLCIKKGHNKLRMLKIYDHILPISMIHGNGKYIEDAENQYNHKIINNYKFTHIYQKDKTDFSSNGGESLNTSKTFSVIARSAYNGISTIKEYAPNLQLAIPGQSPTNASGFTEIPSKNIYNFEYTSEKTNETVTGCTYLTIDHTNEVIYSTGIYNSSPRNMFNEYLVNTVDIVLPMILTTDKYFYGNIYNDDNNSGLKISISKNRSTIGLTEKENQKGITQIEKTTSLQRNIYFTIWRQINDGSSWDNNNALNVSSQNRVEFNLNNFFNDFNNYFVYSTDENKNLLESEIKFVYAETNKLQPQYNNFNDVISLTNSGPVNINIDSSNKKVTISFDIDSKYKNPDPTNNNIESYFCDIYLLLHENMVDLQTLYSIRLILY